MVRADVCDNFSSARIRCSMQLVKKNKSVEADLEFDGLVQELACDKLTLKVGSGSNYLQIEFFDSRNLRISVVVVFFSKGRSCSVNVRRLTKKRL